MRAIKRRMLGEREGMCCGGEGDDLPKKGRILADAIAG